MSSRLFVATAFPPATRTCTCRWWRASSRTGSCGPSWCVQEGEEILFALSGEIELKIGTRTEILRPGDCVQFDSTIPHKLTARTDVPASALVVIAATE